MGENVAAPAKAATVAISEVRFEHLRESLGIGTATPRLSWIVSTEIPGWRQAAYEVQLLAEDRKPRGTTNRVESSESALISWPFEPLRSRERAAVRVRVWGADGSVSALSLPAKVEIGLLLADDWRAGFISPDWPDGQEDLTKPGPGPILRREVELRGPIARARLYVTSLGLYEAEINGQVVGDTVLAPGWTSYNNRLRYSTYDVTNLLKGGQNAIGVSLGDGWYRGRLGFGGGRRNIYGDRLALLAQIEVTYPDNTSETIVTDGAWRAARGPIQASDIYDGETYDARIERPGWSSPGYIMDDSWVGVRPVERDLTKLFAPIGPPMRRIEERKPVSINKSPSGKTIIDFGQNLVGWLRIRVQGEPGATVTLRFAEVLEKGELAIRPLRSAKATDYYILKGDGVEVWEPRFTFHGFRYAGIEGWPGELSADDLTAVIVSSDLERRGWFECSDALINRLHENVIWSMKGNFLDVPTDCPQRDERLGWTGDIQVFSPTASFLFDSAGFLSSWLADLAFDQDSQGAVPFVVPNVINRPITPSSAWADAACVVPWVLYQRYGDSGILATQFDSMRAWVDYLIRLGGDSRLWSQGFHFGDWLDPSAPPENPAAAKTHPHVIATAYFALSAELLGQTAQVLGRTEEAEYYLRIAQEVREAFAREYVTPNGRMMSDATTAYSMAIEFHLLPDPTQRARAGARLAELARDSQYRISTGFVGTPLICDALCSVGEYEAAFRLLTQKDCPSWLYPVTMGATTIWERWDSLLPDGSVNPGQMTSFNHYALGAIADWLHRTVAGLAPAEPGYRRIVVAPHPGGDLTSAAARHKTPYGLAESRWKIEGGQMTLEVTVPPNTTASVILPGKEGEPVEVGSGIHVWSFAFPG